MSLAHDDDTRDPPDDQLICAGCAARIAPGEARGGRLILCATCDARRLLALILDAANDPTVSDGAFRVIVQDLLSPETITDDDMEWAKRHLRKQSE